MIKKPIIIIDPNPETRDQISRIISEMGYKSISVSTAQDGFSTIREEETGVVICNLQLPDSSGMDLLQQSLQSDPDLAFILFTPEATLNSSLQARRLSAYDYLIHPFKPGELENVINRALERAALLAENRLLREEVGTRYDFSSIIGNSRQIREVISLIKKVSLTKSTVLITGETGTGKELVAKAIHYNSPRASKPLVVVNCGAIPENLLESELFGYRKGAFTGAVGNRRGLFAESNQGTLFLDEIGELPLHLQPKILRAIQEEETRPLGGNEPVKLDLRIVAATNKKLENEVKAGCFREELYYRLNVFSINIPPLRERPEDIEILTNHFLGQLNQAHIKAVRGISPNAMAMLKNHSWPGNVRELENVIEQVLLMLDEHKILIEEDDLPIFLERRSAERKRRFITEALAQAISIDDYAKAFIQRFENEYPDVEIARMLGINPKTLWDKRKKWGFVKKRKENGPPAKPAR